MINQHTPNQFRLVLESDLMGVFSFIFIDCHYYSLALHLERIGKWIQ
jgi:hypothetical protein